MLLEFQPLRLRANVSVYFEAYFDMLSMYLMEKMLENLSVSVKIRIFNALKFRRKVMTEQHWLSQFMTSRH